MHYREYVRATGISLLFTFCSFLYYPIISPYIKAMGFDNFQVGLLFSVFPLTVILVSAILGRLADSIGRIKIIVFGLIVEIVATVLYLVNAHWLMIIAARMLNAVAYVAVLLVALAKIQGALSDRDRGKYTGWSLSIAQVGAVVAPVLGGVLADQLFITAPFILTAVLLLMLVFLLIFRTKKLSKKIEQENFNIFKALKTFFSSRHLRGVAVLGFVMHASTPATLVFLPLFIIEKFGLSYSYVGVAIFFFGAAHLFQFFFGALADKYGRVTMILFGCFIMGFFLFFLATIQTYWVLLVLVFLMGIGGAIWNISAWTLMSSIGEKMNKTGEIIGSYMSIAQTGAFISFLMSGLIVQVFGFGVLFALNGFLIAIGMSIASYYFGRYEHSSGN
ncbi:MAG: MFS transporter [archaeon]